MGDKVFRISFDQTKSDKNLVIKNILDFIQISHLIDPKDIDIALEEYSDSKFLASLKTKEQRLYQLNLVRKKKDVSGAWVEGLSPANKLLFKKFSGQFLIELGFERGVNW